MAENYNKNLPGPTRYDNAVNAEQYNNDSTKTQSEKTDDKNNNEKYVFAIVSLVLGISSISALILLPILGALISVPCAIGGIIFGILGMRSRGKTMAIIAIVLSALSFILMIIFTVFLGIFGVALIRELLNAFSSYNNPWILP